MTSQPHVAFKDIPTPRTDEARQWTPELVALCYDLERENTQLRQRLSETQSERDGHKRSLDMLYGEKFSDRCYHALKSRAERAEADSAYAGRLHEIARALLAAHDECRMHDAAQLVIDLRAVLNEKEGMAELVDALPSRVGINPAAALETDGTARMPGNVQLAGSSPAPLTNDEQLTDPCPTCGARWEASQRAEDARTVASPIACPECGVVTGKSHRSECSKAWA